MKRYLIFFSFLICSILSASLSFAAEAEREKVVIISPASILYDLEHSGYIYFTQLENVRSYAKTFNLKEQKITIESFIPGDDRHQILSLVYAPEPWPTDKAFPIIRVSIYFVTPSHYESTMGMTKNAYYRFEMLTDVERPLGRHD